ncbi:FkbM family methyltransferase [Thermodesulfobacteriota bacterium]
MIGMIVRTLKHRGITGSLKIAKNILCYLVYKKILKKRYVTQTINNRKMYLDLDDPGISKELFIFSSREDQLKFILGKLLKKDMVILDVGGNIGYYPLLEATIVGSEGKVHVIEPYPPNYELLLKNIHLNMLDDRILTYQFAAFDKKGTEKFHISYGSNLGTLFPGDLGGSEKSHPLLTGETIDVETKSLSEFISSIEDNIDLIRMDAEGAEVMILRGLNSAIENGDFNGIIVFEAHTSKYNLQNNIRLELNNLSNLGYFPAIVTTDDEAKSTLRQHGYNPEVVIRVSNKKLRGLYRNVSMANLIDHLENIGDIRDVVLVFKSV